MRVQRSVTALGLTLSVSLALVWGAPRPALAGDVDKWVADPLHVQILLRALAYDDACRESKQTQFRIGVLLPPGEANAATSSAILTLFNRTATQRTFLKRSIVVVGVPWPEAPRSLEAAMAIGVDALYLAPGLSRAQVIEVTRATRAQKVVTFTGVGRYVDWGVALGVARGARKKHRLRVHLFGARAEGARFSSQLLQLVDTVGRP